MENNAVIESNTLPAPQLDLGGVVRIPAVRQVMLLIGVAAAVAAGFAIAMWSQDGVYTQLYGDMSGAETADVADALRAAGIDYKLNDSNGSVMVPQARLHDARLQLASQGLPQSASAGMDMMQEQSSFGVSQFMESARYQHALESELARTISSMGAVREARVHLALPKQTSFIRDHKKASASVLLQLNRGRMLEADQASAIVHLIASSVPNLASENVTVIDQNGRLLSSGNEQEVDARVASQFKYSRQLEDVYKRRIEDLLTPLLGAGRIRAEVVADIDFTVTEETRESFDPSRNVIRSEQLSEEKQQGSGSIAAGIPGALSNQPPEASGSTAGDSSLAASTSEPINTSRSSVRNFEVDRTISHVRPQAATIRKLSVAVLVDNTPLAVDNAADDAAGDKGDDAADAAADAAADVATSLTDEDIARFTALVKEVVGFDEARGDTVAVISAAFLKAPELEEAEPPAFWEKPMLRDVLKQVLGAVLVLAIAFGVVRPMLRGVMTSNDAVTAQYLASAPGYATAGGGAMQIAGGTAALAAPNYDDKVAAAKNISGHDPARVAQLVKKWVKADG